MAFQYESRFSELLQKRMDELNYSIKDVSDITGVTYEHIRKCVRGLVAPSKYLAQEICKALAIDIDEANELLAADGIQRRYGRMPSILAGKNPDLEPLERMWGDLTEDQQQGILVQVKALAQRNRLGGNSA